MQNFQNTFETRKRSFISAFSICMTVPLSNVAGKTPRTHLFFRKQCGIKFCHILFKQFFIMMRSEIYQNNHCLKFTRKQNFLRLLYIRIWIECGNKWIVFHIIIYLLQRHSSFWFYTG